MALGRHGPSEVFIHVDGYDLTAEAVQDAQYEEESETADATGLGDSFREHTPTGIAAVALEINNAIFNDAAGRLHELFSTSGDYGPQDALSVVCLGAAGETIGANCVGIEGAVKAQYRVVASFEDLQRANATYQASGARDEGQVLHPLASAGSTDGNTQSSSVDHGSSTTGDAAAYLQVQQTTAGDGITAKVQHSSDDAAWSDLVAFTSVSDTGPTAERKTVSGGVGRYTALAWDYATSPGAATIMAMISRGTTY